MKMKAYAVSFNAGSERNLRIYVEARDCSEAKKVAMAKIMGQAGYAGKRIAITGVRSA